MKQTKVGNIDIIIDPEPEMVIMDKCVVSGIDTSMFKVGQDLYLDPQTNELYGLNHNAKKTHIRLNYGSMSEVKSIIKEPSRARKIYNTLRRLL